VLFTNSRAVEIGGVISAQLLRDIFNLLERTQKTIIERMQRADIYFDS
jgi:hypothetical protein